MHKDFVPPLSVEEFAAYLDGNLSQEDMSRVSSMIGVDNAMQDIVADCFSVDEAVINSEPQQSQIPKELDTLDFYIPNLSENDNNDILNCDNMIEHKNYGYEPNNELDTFDPNVWQGNQPTCAIRSQEIILRDYGIYHSQDELVDFATQNGWFSSDPENGGTDKYAVGNILDACGVPTTRTDNATIYDIISELKAGHRVMVSVDADELWVKKEPNLFKRVMAQVTNKANDTIQDFLGIEGANHALIVAGVNVNPNNPSDIKVTLIDSGTGDVCVEYSFKDFHDAWSDGHCRMISTDVPAPFQYNYHTHQIEPSNIATSYVPSMAQMPDGLTNQFCLSESYYDEYQGFMPEYDEETNLLDVGGSDSIFDSNFYTDDYSSEDCNQTNDELGMEEEQLCDGITGNDTMTESETLSTFESDDDFDSSFDSGDDESCDM